ncbi:hypothetical protein PINS_up008386 [Pythium insidiosum]|nr:hypothetical protein PINS_up008386 [Pythium insidiosum]
MNSSDTTVVPVDGVVYSTCTWKQRVRRDGSCLLQPRTCFECLNVLPTTRESCVLMPSGLCRELAAYDALLDYRRTDYSADRVNMFPSTNTTYCSSDDVACKFCRDTNFASVWKKQPSTHCKSKDGCVCTAICEQYVWESTLRQELQQLLESSSNATLRQCRLRDPDELLESGDGSSSGSGSSSGTGSKSTAIVGLPSKKASTSDENACMWYQNQTKCGAPRSCFDCLNTPIYSGQKCMLHRSGFCTTMDAYDNRKDYRRRANTTKARNLFFPSSNTSYCGPDDDACNACRAQAFARWSAANSTAASPYCVGQGGCVCLASCEAPQWKAQVVALTCSANSTDSGGLRTLAPRSSRLSTHSIIVTTFVGCLASVVTALMLVSRCRLLGFRRNPHAMTQAPRRPRSPTGPALELTGWKAMMEDLIQKEQDFIGGVVLDDRGRRSTNEDTDAPSVQVASGDAFRPLSPSRMHV